MKVQHAINVAPTVRIGWPQFVGQSLVPELHADLPHRLDAAESGEQDGVTTGEAADLCIMTARRRRAPEPGGTFRMELEQHLKLVCAQMVHHWRLSERNLLCKGVREPSPGVRVSVAGGNQYPRLPGARGIISKSVSRNVRKSHGQAPYARGTTKGWLETLERMTELTATVTATAATNGKQRRSATAHNARAFRSNSGMSGLKSGRSERPPARFRPRLSRHQCAINPGKDRDLMVTHGQPQRRGSAGPDRHRTISVGESHPWSCFRGGSRHGNLCSNRVPGR